MTFARSLVPSLLVLATGCASARLEPSRRPAVEIRTTGGVEQGVSTDEGVLFLGRTARSGPAKVTYLLGPSPLVEAGEVRHFGGVVHEVRLEVPLPSVPIGFEPLSDGEDLVLLTLHGNELARYDLRAIETDELGGGVLSWPSGLALGPTDVGAGVYRDTHAGLVLVGLVKGTATLAGRGRYVLLDGIATLRVALAQPNPAVLRREVHYRADGTRVNRIR